MPQMSPMYWLVLIFYFIFTLMMMMMSIYFSYFNVSNKHMTDLSISQLN